MQKIVQKLLLPAFLVVALSLISCPGDIPTNPTTKTEGIESIPYRETVSMEAAAGVNNGYLTAADGVSDYSQITGSSTSFVHYISPFEISKYEVTYELWYFVLTWAEDHGYLFGNPGMEGSVSAGSWPSLQNIGKAPTENAKHEPVTMISWMEAYIWCNAYSEMLGLTPCYTSKGNILKKSDYYSQSDFDTVECNWDANGYRIPSLGEWSYAASCAGTYTYEHVSGADGTTTATSGASDIDGDGDIEYTTDVCWYRENSSTTGMWGEKTHPVGTKSPNIFGLFDMSGNVAELTWNYCGSDYPTTAQYNYHGPSMDTFLFAPGSDYDDSSFNMQLTKGRQASMGYYHRDIGFRLVRTITQ